LTCSVVGQTSSQLSGIWLRPTSASAWSSRAVKKEDVLRRRQNYDAVKARLAQVEKDLALTKAGAWAPDLEIARTQVAQAEAARHQDEVNIERLTTRAPIDGRILQNKIRLGQFAQCGPLAEPLMIFGGKGAMHLRVDVDEADAWKSKPAIPRLHIFGATANLLIFSNLSGSSLGDSEKVFDRRFH
jgi:hypothetical protein